MTKVWEDDILPSKFRRAEFIAHQKEKATQNQQKEETRVRKAVAKEDCLSYPGKTYFGLSRVGLEVQRIG